MLIFIGQTRSELLDQLSSLQLLVICCMYSWAHLYLKMIEEALLPYISSEMIAILGY
jgi:hypothetical protein